MIKFVLSSLPLYYLSFFKLFKGVESRIIKVQRNFLWKKGKASVKIAGYLRKSMWTKRRKRFGD